MRLPVSEMPARPARGAPQCPRKELGEKPASAQSWHPLGRDGRRRQCCWSSVSRTETGPRCLFCG